MLYDCLCSGTPNCPLGHCCTRVHFASCTHTCLCCSICSNKPRFAIVDPIPLWLCSRYQCPSILAKAYIVTQTRGGNSYASNSSPCTCFIYAFFFQCAMHIPLQNMCPPLHTSLQCTQKLLDHYKRGCISYVFQGLLHGLSIPHVFVLLSSVHTCTGFPHAVTPSICIAGTTCSMLIHVRGFPIAYWSNVEHTFWYIRSNETSLSIVSPIPIGF